MRRVGVDRDDLLQPRDFGFEDRERRPLQIDGAREERAVRSTRSDGVVPPLRFDVRLSFSHLRADGAVKIRASVTVS